MLPYADDDLTFNLSKRSPYDDEDWFFEILSEI
jgi:hypothetical protein